MHINLKIARQTNKRRIKRIQKVKSLMIEGNHADEQSKKKKLCSRTGNKTTAES